MIRARSDRQMARRSVARMLLSAMTVALTWFFYSGHGVDLDKDIKIAVFFGSLPAAWAIAALLSTKDSIEIDLERRLVISGKKRKEVPIDRLCPLVFRRHDSYTDMHGRTHSVFPVSYYVNAKGWQNYVVLQGWSRRRAERRFAELSAIVGCGKAP